MATMIQGTRTYLAKRLLRQLIEIATHALYSEQFDVDAIVTRMSRNRAGVPLLRAYVAVQIAARLAEPLNDADVDRALDAVQLSEVHFEEPVFRDILDVHRELAEHYWARRHLTILRGKLAHKNDEHSYDGTIYSLEHSKIGPIPMEERAKCEALCKQIADLNRQIEIAELDAWKKQDEDEYQRYKEELDALALSAEVDANEEETMQLESAEVVSILEAKLNALLNSRADSETQCLEANVLRLQTEADSLVQEVGRQNVQSSHSEPQAESPDRVTCTVEHDGPLEGSRQRPAMQTPSPADFEAHLAAQIAAANSGISHADFVNGVRARSLGFTIMNGEPSQFLTGTRERVFRLLVMAYSLLPILAVPFLSWHAGNWWLLFGLVASYIGTFMATFRTKLIFLVTLVAIGWWLKNGLHPYDLTTFSFLCVLFGYLVFQMAESAQRRYVLDTLLESREVFDAAVASNKIMIVRSTVSEQR